MNLLYLDDKMRLIKQKQMFEVKTGIIGKQLLELVFRIGSSVFANVL